ncbi:hypothetical protein MFUL124B02_43065 [Myxococcus fulvus 124B02]|nr:hypothetical protein MFUL124B02_43065 [Myxococcus fulvus 124B02]
MSGARSDVSEAVSTRVSEAVSTGFSLADADTGRAAHALH